MAKDYTKYNVEGIEGKFNKARLVQTIVKHYVENNVMLWDIILTAFPFELQGKKGVISKKSEVEKEHDVVIIHDDIVDYTFCISTKNFDLAKITFLQFALADEVRQSAPELVANYLCYGDEHIAPDKDRHRDKGIELEYKPQYGGLSALLEG